MAEPLALPRGGHALAREAAGEEGDGSNNVRSELSDVGMAGDSEAALPHPSPPLVGLAAPGVLPAGHAESEVEQSDAAEDRSGREAIHAASLSGRGPNIRPVVR